MLGCVLSVFQCVCALMAHVAHVSHVAHVTLQPIYVLPPCTGNPNSNRIQYQAIFLSQPPPLSPLILHGVRAWVPNPSSGDGGWLVVLAGDCLRGEGLCGRRRGGIPDLRGGGSREVKVGSSGCWRLLVV